LLVAAAFELPTELLTSHAFMCPAVSLGRCAIAARLGLCSARCGMYGLSWSTPLGSSSALSTSAPHRSPSLSTASHPSRSVTSHTELGLGMDAAAQPFQAQVDPCKSMFGALLQISPTKRSQPLPILGSSCATSSFGACPGKPQYPAYRPPGPTRPRRACHGQFNLRSRRSHREGPAGPGRGRVPGRSGRVGFSEPR
jgi:hypothetical protein